MGCVTCSYRIS